MSPLLKSVFKINLFILLLCQSTRGHMLWQQQIIGNGPSFQNYPNLMTLYTFSEKPGIAQVEAERMSEKAYGKGVKAHIQTDNGDTELDVCLDGKFLKARISPFSMMNSKSYALESYVDWGAYGEHGPASLIRFFTSASHVDNNIEQAMQLSTNNFKFYMTSMSSEEEECEGSTGMMCLKGMISFSNEPLFNHSVSFYNGDTGEALGEAVSDEEGVVMFPVGDTLVRVFGKVRHEQANPGMTIDGEEYVKVANYASTFLEMGDFDVEPSNDSTGSASATSGSVSYSISSMGSADASSMSGFFIGACAALVGSFLGTFFSNKMSCFRRRRHDQVSTVEVETMKLDAAETSML